MVHYAGYAPRFHPSDFETRMRDGVGYDWPISYGDLKAHYERVERELPVSGQYWPWGDPHGYPHAPHPIGGAAERAWEGARAHGVEMRVGPTAITNGVFGNRPHCIYRGFCLQGCKVNAKASPLVTHVPDATRARRRDPRRLDGGQDRDRRGRRQGHRRDLRRRARPGASASSAPPRSRSCGYSIESPRLLLHSDRQRASRTASRMRTTRSAAT